MYSSLRSERNILPFDSAQGREIQLYFYLFRAEDTCIGPTQSDHISAPNGAMFLFYHAAGVKMLVMGLKIGAKKDTGRMRETQEDEVLVFQKKDLVVLGIADRMDRLFGGEIASKIAVETVLSFAILDFSSEHKTIDS